MADPQIWNGRPYYYEPRNQYEHVHHVEVYVPRTEPVTSDPTEQAPTDEAALRLPPDVDDDGNG